MTLIALPLTPNHHHHHHLHVDGVEHHHHRRHLHVDHLQVDDHYDYVVQHEHQKVTMKIKVLVE